MRQRYDTYKDSGVQWLGEIPGHWEVLRIKNICECYGRIGFRGYTTNDFVTEGCGAITISPSNMKDIKMDFSRCSYLSWKKYYESPEIQIKEGDVLFVKTGSTYGKTSYVDYLPTASTINPQIVCFKNHKQSPKFLAFLFNTKVGKMQVEFSLVGGTIPTIAQSKIVNYSFAFPPLSEQRSIVSYLDAKCGKIDEWVTKKQKEVEHLQELKQRVIADAVTRGLNPHVKMKATNIPWLKEIPEHWEVKPIRAILRENTDKTETGDEELLSLSQYTGISRKKDAAKIGMFEAESTVGYKKVHPGQFVMNIMLAWNGSYAVSEFEGIISPAYCVFDFISKDEKMYYNYLWRLSMYQGAFKTESRGIIDSRLRLYPSKFLPFPTICPPIEEQKQIVSYLDAKCAKIDKLIANINKEIERIKEYKQRLISDVVTGQIKVC